MVLKKKIEEKNLEEKSKKEKIDDELDESDLEEDADDDSSEVLEIAKLDSGFLLDTKLGSSNSPVHVNKLKNLEEEVLEEVPVLVSDFEEKDYSVINEERPEAENVDEVNRLKDPFDSRTSADIYGTNREGELYGTANSGSLYNVPDETIKDAYKIPGVDQEVVLRREKDSRLEIEGLRAGFGVKMNEGKPKREENKYN